MIRFFNLFFRRPQCGKIHSYCRKPRVTAPGGTALKRKTRGGLNIHIARRHVWPYSMARHAKGNPMLPQTLPTLGRVRTECFTASITSENLRPTFV